jgi:hypothetical protein
MNGFLYAQTTYTSFNYIGTQDTLLFSSSTLELNQFDFELKGANKNWDFSTLSAETQKKSSYLSPSNGGYQNTWCFSNGYLFNCTANFENLTNLAKYESDSLPFGPVQIENRISHQRLQNSTLQNTMLGLTVNIEGIPIPFTFDYENEDTIYQFPIEYLSVDSSSSKIMLDFYPLPVTQIRHLKRINEVEGWGELITPYGQFSTVLKMKTILSKIDTILIDSIPIPYPRTTIEYKWWDPAYGLPVLTVTGNRIGGIDIITNITYLDSVRCLSPRPLFTFSPLAPQLDPNNKTVEVTFTNFSNNTDSVFWDFGDGSYSSNFSPTHTFACEGLKNVTLFTFNNCNSVFQEENLSLPIYVSSSTTTLDTSIQYLCANASIFINGQYETENGFYEEATQDENGCDSLYIIDLKTPIFDNTINIASDTISSNMTNASYRWLDCDQSFEIIENETNVYFHVNSSGNFAVELSLNGCKDTSACVETISTSLQKKTLERDFYMYPNPAYNKLIVESFPNENVEYIVYSIFGKEQIRSKKSILNIAPLLPGSYFIRLKNNSISSSPKYFIKM